MNLKPLLVAIPLLLGVQPALGEEPFTYMMPQILWPNPRGPERKLCPSCAGTEMKGIDPARLFDTGAAPKTAVPAEAKTVHRVPTRHKTAKAHRRTPCRHLVAHAPSVHKPALRATVQKSVSQATAESPCPKVTAQTQKLMDQQRFDDAEQYLKSVLVEYPYDKCIRKIFVQLALWRAYNFMKCGNIECAARRIREALFVDPSNTAARYMLDRCYLDSGVDPCDPKALSAFAQGLLKSNRYVAAFVDYEHLVAVAPDANSYIGYARAAQKLGQNQLAMASYSEAIKADPLNAGSWRDLGLVCDKLGENKLAQDALLQSLALSPDDDVTSNALIAIVQRQLETHPDDPQLHLQLAHIHILAGDYSEADSEYSKAELIRDGDETFKQQIKADRTAAQSERDRAPEFQQAIAAAARDAAAREFETKGPSPLRNDLKPQPDVAYNCSCN